MPGQTDRALCLIRRACFVLATGLVLVAGLAEPAAAQAAEETSPEMLALDAAAAAVGPEGELRLADDMLRMSVLTEELDQSKANEEFAAIANEIEAAPSDPQRRARLEARHRHAFEHLLARIEDRMRSAPDWPADRAPNEYAAIAQVRLERLRDDYDQALRTRADPRITVREAEALLALTGGMADLGPDDSVFAGQEERVRPTLASLAEKKRQAMQVAGTAGTATAGGENAGSLSGSFAWLDKSRDEIGTGRAAADGTPDGRFQLTLRLPAPAEILSIALFSADAAGQPSGGQVWHTSERSNWLLGVFDEDRWRNRMHLSSLGEFEGVETLELYAADSGWFNPGQNFLVEVTFGDGTKWTRTAIIGGPPASIAGTLGGAGESARLGEQAATTGPMDADLTRRLRDAVTASVRDEGPDLPEASVEAVVTCLMGTLTQLSADELEMLAEQGFDSAAAESIAEGHPDIVAAAKPCETIASQAAAAQTSTAVRGGTTTDDGAQHGGTVGAGRPMDPSVSQKLRPVVTAMVRDEYPDMPAAGLDAGVTCLMDTLAALSPEELQALAENGFDSEVAEQIGEANPDVVAAAEPCRTIALQAAGVGTMGTSDGGATAGITEETTGAAAEVITVRADAAQPVRSETVLEAGRPYVLEASGEFSVWDAGVGVDAVWCYREGPCTQPQLWAQLRVDGRALHEIAGGTPPYDPAHVYRVTLEGQGRPVDLVIQDAANGSGGDNSGALTVRISPADEADSFGATTQQPRTGQGGDAIQVTSATYGGNCGVAEGNVTQHVAGSCDGRSSCDYKVDYTVIGDPAYGCGKDFVVRWRCGSRGGEQSSSAPGEAGFGSVVQLQCTSD